jgi:hypothetical protein
LILLRPGSGKEEVAAFFGPAPRLAARHFRPAVLRAKRGCCGGGLAGCAAVRREVLGVRAQYQQPARLKTNYSSKNIAVRSEKN